MPQSPDALLLLPGLLNDPRLWAYQADALGNERPVHIADLTRDDSIPAMARRVLAEAPPRFALGALSMGGYVAFEILRQAPQRVTRLALLDTMASPDSPARAANRKGLLELARHGRFVGVSPALLRRLIHPRHLGTPVADTVRAMARDVGREGFIRQQQAIIQRRDALDLLPRLCLPTLILVGADDLITPPEEARLMHQAIPGSRLAVIPECGHLPPLEAPEQTLALLREWLA